MTVQATFQFLHCDYVIDERNKRCPFTTIFGTLITNTVWCFFFIFHLTYFVHLLYSGKLSRPKYQKKLNKIMKFHRKMQFWLKISICQSSMVHKGCWVNCLTRVGNLETSTLCWRESARQVQLLSNQAVADRVCHVIIIIIIKLTNLHKEWPVVYNCKE